MRLADGWNVLIANVTVLVVCLVVRRWHRSMSLGYFAVALVVLPVAFAYLSGRLALVEFVGPLVGIIILAADLKEHLPWRRKPGD